MIAKIIETHCILSYLSNNQQKDCVQYFTKWKYNKDTYIYRQHDPPDSLFLIGTGIVAIEIDCNPVKKL